jgi:hypothetical protein
MKKGKPLFFPEILSIWMFFSIQIILMQSKSELSVVPAYKREYVSKQDCSPPARPPCRYPYVTI